ncbi:MULTISPECIES: helix-turn-helix transcriptional regulator [Rhizobium]|uniref:Transcriptional regulator with XRE-family HTH domain n=1 Tax=Rhizobium metallidurans TaxID=1265931 RepID=A0A7W6CJZ0_9HYPH|nr:MULTISPECIES: helix-turn-helix transcriptional regulator [Rhizobium]MBB3962447.1 transcriptional regulator with XRE-family HTH domain [Rhizobium metallidurans]
MKAKSTNAIDGYVGERVRLRRKMLGMSQASLAEALGITFQQIQKYEKGINRIGASRLLRMAEIFGVAVGYFFEDGLVTAGDDNMRPETDAVAAFMASKEGLALGKAFIAIEDPNVRQKLLALTRSLGSSGIVIADRDGADQT